MRWGRPKAGENGAPRPSKLQRRIAQMSSREIAQWMGQSMNRIGQAIDLHLGGERVELREIEHEAEVLLELSRGLVEKERGL